MFKNPLAIRDFEKLNNEYHFKSVVETGTYHAESTLILAQYVPLVFTVENNPEEIKIAVYNILDSNYRLISNIDGGHYAFLKENPVSVINLFLFDSAKWLQSYLPLVSSPACFFLDAHWQSYWPVLDELKALKGRTKDVVIIHDFKVLGKDFGYDTYGGQPLEFDYVKADLMNVNPEFKIKYNEEAAGDYRGILYALPK